MLFSTDNMSCLESVKNGDARINFFNKLKITIALKFHFFSHCGKHRSLIAKKQYTGVQLATINT